MLRSLWSTAPLLLALATLFWSGNFVLGRAVHEHIPPIALAFFRWAGAFVIVLGFAWPHLKRDWPTLRAQPGRVALLSLLGVATFNSMVYFGLNTTTVMNAVLLQSTMPLLIVLGSFLIYREPVRRIQMLALLISLAGVAVIISHGSVQALLALALRPGDGIIFLAVVLYGMYSVLLRERPKVHPLSFCAGTFAIGSLMLLPVYLVEHVGYRQMHFDGPTALALVYVMVFPSLLAYLCFNRAVELIGANRAGQYLHLMPVFGTLLAAIFLGERLQGFHVVGAVLIAAGILLAQFLVPPKPA
ncbi:drug/metabolite transporter (DMT)-like permease [Panacagrimonas perspica]|uniref:Drug/metabolite transporter (DMT)-like permease n=1 Tax=Panacagrimonas perspica TaxID=381431 RepID=A0A4R7PGB3_9GAMM|nr:DMT family transporter [Panacagrimonas perspica]TDU32749.1 drug/metabolite transporter (DMT)-like permease [Panacagrimonas perspica]THD05629.1 hypothetical protein B1810_02630 [Panacagrimonas perspica]